LPLKVLSQQVNYILLFALSLSVRPAAQPRGAKPKTETCQLKNSETKREEIDIREQLEREKAQIGESAPHGRL
jgi:hypothetical protein